MHTAGKVTRETLTLLNGINEIVGEWEISRSSVYRRTGQSIVDSRGVARNTYDHAMGYTAAQKLNRC